MAEQLLIGGDVGTTTVKAAGRKALKNQTAFVRHPIPVQRVIEGHSGIELNDLCSVAESCICERARQTDTYTPDVKPDGVYTDQFQTYVSVVDSNQAMWSRVWGK